ncbi:hypothetical protein [Massilia endophytica]|uniref:hypothetical protein n=1 Tax=Massilia endophytica TaxID=2899220 RepID=UPI001E3F6A7E|nr:hypothetical protein [Massilia endophytica]UGQ48236.1 hypothetical protein LSQ66_07175 [Massilia endophytica]
MNSDRRIDSRLASVVMSALRLSRARGRVQAWHYLRKRAFSAQIALRVLSTRGPRRNSDVKPGYEAFTVPGTSTGGAEQRSVHMHMPGDAVSTLNRRVNETTAAICERAVRAIQTESREYAESLLRMYSLKTATIMRVLYHPTLRRR